MWPRSLPWSGEFVTSEIEGLSVTSWWLASRGCGTEANSGCAGVVAVAEAMEATARFGFGFGFGFGLVATVFVAVEAG